MIVANTPLELIGKTPLLNVSFMSPKRGVQIWAKLEWYNIFGSTKDRIALKMIENAEKSGKLKKGMTIIEATSGNTGIAVSAIGRLKGYDVIIVMSAAMSIERVLIMKAFGAKVVLTPAEKGIAGAQEYIEELLRKNPGKYFYINQFGNMDNVNAHYEGTGPEIWRQTNGKITHLVAAMGTGGTIVGVAKFLKERNPKIKVIGVETQEGDLIPGMVAKDTKVKRTIIIPEVIDKMLYASSEIAFRYARELTRHGIFIGPSSGAAIWGAITVANEIDEGFIVTIFVDNGYKYLTLPVYRDEKVVEKIIYARKTSKIVEI